MVWEDKGREVFSHPRLRLTLVKGINTIQDLSQKARWQGISIISIRILKRRATCLLKNFRLKLVYYDVRESDGRCKSDIL